MGSYMEINQDGIQNGSEVERVLVSDIYLIHGPQNLWGKFDSSIRIRPPCQENILYQPLSIEAWNSTGEILAPKLGTNLENPVGCGPATVLHRVREPPQDCTGPVLNSDTMWQWEIIARMEWGDFLIFTGALRVGLALFWTHISCLGLWLIQEGASSLPANKE